MKKGNIEVQTQNMINTYENRIDELQQKIEEYVQKENENQEEISDLKNKILMYENDNE